MSAQNEPSAPADAAARQGVEYDESRMITAYANFCRVTGTAEELIVDFGLNASNTGVASAPLSLSQRIVMNLFTAKRLLHLLEMSVQRHEATFGALETDVQKRVLPSARSAAQSSPRSTA